MNIELDDFRPLQRNSLRGFARITLRDGVKLHDVAVHFRDGKAWASPPGKPMIGRDGCAMKDAAGKAQYAPVVTFVDRAAQNAFSDAVIAALRGAYPEALR